MVDQSYLQRQLHPFGLPPEQRERVLPAVLAIGLLVSTVLVAITPFNDNLIMGTYFAGNHFPIGAFLILIVLVLTVNVLLGKWFPHLALRPAQLVAIWALIAIPSGIPSSGMMRYFVPTGMVGYRYYASAENKWEESLGDQVPEALIVNDKIAVKKFFEGLSPGQPVPWTHWVRPVVSWGVYAFALYAMMIGLSVMLRRRWVEHERFTFPLVQVPIELAGQPQPGMLLNRFLRNKLVWIPVSVVVLLHSFRGLHNLYPAVPSIPIHSSIIFGELPFSWAGSLDFKFYPLMIGFAYLITSEVCFSLVLFHLLYKLQAIIMGSLAIPMKAGATVYGGYNWAVMEEAGGTIGLAFWFIWAGKNHFLSIFRRAFSRNDSVDDADEPLGYQTTAICFLLGTGLMILWLYYFGGSLILAVINVLVGIAVYITLAWMVTQGGLIFVQPTFTTTAVVTSLTGSQRWQLRGLLVNFWNEQVFRMDLREYLLPSLLNGYKISDGTNLSRSSLFQGSIAAIVLAFFASLASAIWLPYTAGGAVSLKMFTMSPNTYQRSPQLPFRWLAALTVMPAEASVSNAGHFGAGLLLMMLTMYLRARISWFVLHPIGFLIASGYPIRCMWFSVFLGWIIKGGVTRWGGYKVYQTLRPFFFGLIIGDCLAGAIWIVIGFITKTGYMVLPG